MNQTATETPLDTEGEVEETKPVIEESVTTDSSDDSTDFGDVDQELFDETDESGDTDLGDTVEEKTPVSETETTAEETPQETPATAPTETPAVETPTAETETPAEPATPEQTPPVEEPPTAVQQPEESPAETPAEPVDYAKMRADAATEIQERYALSEEDVQLMTTEPEKVLPKMASRLYMDVFENVTQGIMGAIPGMIQQTILSQEAVRQADNAFYGKWNGKLDAGNNDHKAMVDRVGAVYRQVNPNATKDQYIAEVGAQVLMALGIPFQDIVDAPAGDVIPPVTPATPAAITPPTTPRKMNQFESLSEEFLDEDQN